MTKVSRTRIANTIAKHTLGGGANKGYAGEIASYLLSENRVSQLDSILRDVQTVWADEGYVEAIVTSAHPLTASMKQEITAQVKNQYQGARKITITETRDPELMGGVRISLPHSQLDLSVRAKLNKLEQLTI